MADPKSMYRPKALERLSSPESLDQLLRLVDPRSWIPLAVLSVLVGFLLLWAIFGRVPINVQGKGILVRPRKVVEFQSPGSGHLLDLKVRVGDVVGRGDLLGLIAQPDGRPTPSSHGSVRAKPMPSCRSRAWATARRSGPTPPSVRGSSSAPTA